MIISRSILLACLLRHAAARDLNYVKSKGREARSNPTDRNLKADTKTSVTFDTIESKQAKKDTRGTKGGKAPAQVSTGRPSKSPASSPQPEISDGEDADAMFSFPITSFPSPWPTYYPVEVSEFPTDADIGLDADLVIGVRTPDCPPLLRIRTTPRPIAVDTLRPTIAPSLEPSVHPTTKPTPMPTAAPSSKPTVHPTPKPTPKPAATTITFQRGAMLKDIKRFGFKVSRGITVRMIAQADKYVNFANGKRSDLRYHAMPDGAAVFQLPDGYVYVNNAEIKEGRGGVYGLYFDGKGGIVDYKELLSGTSRSCSGGKTPWNTYVSCEEVQDGQCWQIDPDPSSKYHNKPEPTEIGRGYFEAIACDNRDPTQPVFYVVEDTKFGALRKYTPPAKAAGAIADWSSLHTMGGTTEFLLFIDDKTFTWTSCDEDAARLSQAAHFPFPEGVDVKNGLLNFVSKKTYKLYTLDLDKGTYTTMWTNSTLVGEGEFGNSPDQIVRNNGGDFLYFTEDGGSTPGVYALDSSGRMHGMFEAYDSMYKGDETTGLAFSPDGNKMYASFQDCGCEVSNDVDCGCLFQFTRDDGLSFDDESK